MFRPKIDRISYGGCIIDNRERDAINRVIDSQGGRRWTIGPESEAFERELADKTGMKHSVLYNSGSSALLAAVASLKLPKGSKVIVPALNFPTAYSSILVCGLIPVVVDCDLTTLNISLEQVKLAITGHPDVKAVIAVHIAGNVVDLVKLREIVGNRYIISDNCDGYGGTLRGKFIDTYADLSCISMHAAHIISMGEGGAVITNNKELASRARKIREWGRASGSDTLTKHEGFPPDYRERYVFEEIGFNMKPLELQCAMGRIQLTRLEDFKMKRRVNYDMLYNFLQDVDDFALMGEIEGADNCWFSFPLLTENRPEVMKAFEDNNIETRTIFSGNILRHPAYKDEPHIQIGTLDNSDYVMRCGMFLSVHPSLEPEMIRYVSTVAHEL